MIQEYASLTALRDNIDYQTLKVCWAGQGQKIIDAMKRAAARGQESAWRFYAGQMAGFELAVTQLERSIAEMEAESQNKSADTNVDDLLKQIKGEQK